MMPVNTGRLLQHPSNTVQTSWTFGQRWVDVAMTSRVLWDVGKWKTIDSQIVLNLFINIFINLLSFSNLPLSENAISS